METRAERLSPLPENVVDISVSRRKWNGICVDVNATRCSGPAEHPLCLESHTRLSALLEEVGVPCEPRLREGRPCAIGYVPRQLNLIPAGMPLWGYSANSRLVRDAVLTFDLKDLGERLGQPLSPTELGAPRLRFVDDRLWTLMRLLADVVDDDDPATQLYGDGLTAALFARLGSRRGERPSTRKGLAPWQLRRVLDFMESRLPGRVELSELAALVDLSQAHFSRAFKASTGVAPYQWQLRARLERAQAMMLSTPASLEQVAEATGFADAVHFGKAFRRAHGTTPARWRRDRKD
ncbi:helix-turn-helix domain-containing protein [Corallococcus exiguus]|uniref:AraC family transcriptional regulator n=1 Tax=Corallococcus TaxID=83461 RepID=UPI000EA0C220|nr:MULTISPECIES: helix-turn-helix domain-containing protein [unclassified Corallococcus]NNB98445.1 helix-turn-helix domain-containing protein [Corallococcus exiguus]NNC05541.1 helix-turn-helix domain-containing protein [Corallococcus exiguus]NPC50798.1 helix-turn-helix domain-containing protein [Corallococcus exiguus]NRD48890.1 helix-turn-helix domain-containing protein [Corallococcus exiguus]NRD59064.1 helix-turn-helix domain-containing protein [Corallococcus exiguus]